MVQQKIKLDLSKVKMAIRAGIPLSIKTYTLPHEMEMYMDEVLTAFLKELNQYQMIEYLTYCLNELVTNAKKANTKRIYFKEKGLDIFNKADYERGMKTFKEDTLNNLKYYLRLQKQAGLYVKLILQIRNNRIKIEVRNNSELTYDEFKRIHDKLSRSQQYTSVAQAMSNILDETEGAGLGLVIIIFMLEKIGLQEENFQVLSENGETITRIWLPVSEKTQNDIKIVSAEIANIIEEIPRFPENIMRINKLLNDPNSKMSEIAMLISSDVSLTTDLLKIVNSATFALASPCRSISDAVKLIGIRGIKNMLISVGSINSLQLITGKENAELWTHSYKVAFYTYNLARNFCSSERSIVEDAYVCGLLHDMGKLVFETMQPNSTNSIQSICAQKGIPAKVFEKLLTGVSHSTVGALIAEKWNFPDVIISVIRHHHEPELAGDDTKKLTSLVYFADLLAHYEDGEVEYDQFDESILSMFHITTEEHLKMISDRLRKAFEREPYRN